MNESPLKTDLNQVALNFVKFNGTVNCISTEARTRKQEEQNKIPSEATREGIKLEATGKHGIRS